MRGGTAWRRGIGEAVGEASGLQLFREVGDDGTCALVDPYRLKAADVRRADTAVKGTKEFSWHHMDGILHADARTLGVRLAPASPHNRMISRAGAALAAALAAHAARLARAEKVEALKVEAPPR